MREILFRGQTRRKGEKVRMDGTPVESNWVYGGVFQGPNRSIIYGYEPIEKRVVYTDTVGQYTGLTDKNGKKIFEGDIVTIPGSKRRGLPATVEYFPQGAVFQIRRVGYNAITLWDANESVEVIGNIYDNPELLEAQS